MRKFNYIVVFVLMIASSNSICQTNRRNTMNDALQRGAEIMGKMADDKQREDAELNRVNQEIIEIVQQTINEIYTLDIFEGSLVKDGIQNCAANYNNRCVQIKNDRGADRINQLNNARNDIYNYSMEILRSDFVIFLMRMRSERTKLANYINTHELNEIQFEKLTKDYKRFIANPFEKDGYNNYKGYLFKPNVIFE